MKLGVLIVLVVFIFAHAIISALGLTQIRKFKDVSHTIVPVTWTYSVTAVVIAIGLFYGYLIIDFT